MMEATKLWMITKYAVSDLDGIRRSVNHSVRVGDVLTAQMLEQGSVTPAMVAAGYLHDIVEDRAVTIGDIQREFSNDITELVNLLTRPDGMDYADYIDRIGDNECATRIKLVDLFDNLLFVDLYPSSLRKRYIDAIDTLTGYLDPFDI